MHRQVVEFMHCIIVALALVIFFSVPVTFAQTDKIQPVRMAYLEYAPYSFTDTDGSPKGLAIDLARRLVGVIGAELEFVSVANPTEMMELIRSGTVDIAGLLASTKDRLEIAPMTAPVDSFRTSLFVKKSLGARTLEEFDGRKVGGLEGSVILQAASKIPNAQIFTYPTSDERLLALLRGDIDGTVSTLNGFSATLRSIGADVLIHAIEPPLEETTVGFYVTKSQTALLEALNREITNHLTQKEMRAFHDIWFGTPTRLWEHQVVFWGSIASACFLVIAVFGLIALQFQRAKARILRGEKDQHQLLIDALDGVDAAIVIFNDKLEAIHWNKGFSKSLPLVSGILEQGTGLRDMIAGSYKSGAMVSSMDEAEAIAFADHICENLKAGKTMNRIVHASDGRVLDATDFSIGRNQFASVRVDVTKLHQQAATILEQQSDLSDANEKLAMFATIAAHDLRAPLMQQTNLIEFIKEDLEKASLELSEDIQQYFGLLTDSSTRMQNLIVDLLEHAKAAQTLIWIDPNERMPKILVLAGLPSQFVVKIEAGLPNVFVDPTSFDTVMRNLISNAVKHHDCDEGVIRIFGHEERGIAIIKIEDDGTGIPEEYRTSIFEPFKRLSSKVEGSGLGLSFVYKTVTKWGGNIHVECANPRGSTFVLTIPNGAKKDGSSSSERQTSLAA
ncbi:ATP-binding protein [Pseudosulfitobacter sp. SM2401]|uniref:ATP-binding protein n=1 Tax=Pseudosulfitobacter sp. SM2401 TaxID=3350098 RepID=UPI0036F3DF52